MATILYFGWIATALSVVYKIPQIYLMVKHNKSEGLSVISYLIQTLSYIFYIIHGAFIIDSPVIAMGIASLIQNIIVLSLWIHIKKSNAINFAPSSSNGPAHWLPGLCSPRRCFFWFTWIFKRTGSGMSNLPPSSGG